MKKLTPFEVWQKENGYDTVLPDTMPDESFDDREFDDYDTPDEFYHAEDENYEL